MKFGNLKIGVRLGLAFGMLLLFITGIAYTGWSALSGTKAHVDMIVNENIVKSGNANDIRQGLNVVAQSVRNYILYPDKEMQKDMLERIGSSRKDMDAALDSMGRLVRSEKAKQLYAAMKDSREELHPLLDKVIALVDAGKVEEATGFMAKSVQGPQDKFFGLLTNLINLLEQQNREAAKQMDQDYIFAVRFLIGAVLIALAAGVFLAWLITRSITRPIGLAVEAARMVASGDLTGKIEVQTRDETGQLMQALQDMSGSLRNIVAEVRTGTDTIATASGQIASGNLDLSSRTEQQAGSLEETAAAMEELTGTVKQNADNAGQANQLAVSASDVALKGGAVVAQVVETMSSINTSSKKIADIIGVIDGIAFQTNILALNAAVEAARAGEQGRGFAVVATEVRNLAQRSAAAAREIKTLIGDSVDQVDIGVKLVDQAGVTMGEIVESVKRVTDIMSEIMAASQEQTTGIEQINQAIMQMDAVTQQNAALVEESAAAAASLQDQTGNLVQVVSVFKTERRQAAAGPSLTVASRPAPVAKVAAIRLAAATGSARG